MVDEQSRAERSIDALQQPVRHGRAGKAELCDRAGVASSEIGVADQIVVQRRHEIKAGDPLARDVPQCRRRAEVMLADERAVDERHRQQ